MTYSVDSHSFAGRLRSERLRLGLSQGEVAARAEIAKPTQVAYEQGGRTPTVDYLVPLSELGFDVWYLEFGIRAARHASLVFNWELLGAIHAAVSTWCSSREVELTPQEHVQVARLLYDQFLEEEQVEELVVDRMLTVVASRRAA